MTDSFIHDWPRAGARQWTCQERELFNFFTAASVYNRQKDPAGISQFLAGTGLARALHEWQNKSLKRIEKMVNKSSGGRALTDTVTESAQRGSWSTDKTWVTSDETWASRCRNVS
eukprot:scpid102571/ scgid26966/ 